MANSIIISFNNDDIMSKQEAVAFFDEYGEGEKHSENASLIKAFRSEEAFTHAFPLLEDITLEYQSQYQQLSDIFGIAGRIQNILTSVQSLSGTASSISNIFTYEMWKSTDPLALNFKTRLYAKTNPALDVWYLSALVSSQSIISKIVEDGKTRYKLPGLSLGGATQRQKQMTLSQRKAELEADKKSTNAKTKADAIAELKTLEDKEKAIADAGVAEGKALGSSTQGYQKIVQVYIPGIIFIKDAMIVSAKPTYSRQTALVNGIPFPIWCELDIQIKSVSPAHTGFYTEAMAVKNRELNPPTIK